MYSRIATHIQSCQGSGLRGYSRMSYLNPDTSYGPGEEVARWFMRRGSEVSMIAPEMLLGV